jgi:ABC-2 type transport system ATP-binding protein
VIEIKGLSKSYGTTKALDRVSFVAPPGMVTGFLGPNGAGKTTTLRILLGLARPDAGTALIDGSRYADLHAPRQRVGAVLDSTGFHPGRTGRNHLRVVARAAGIPRSQIERVLDFVQLTNAAGRRAGGYSHGMRQRLALAGALLADPQVLVLDEPATGLDPGGIAWLRGLLSARAERGRTVLFSSHALAEVEAVADRVVIIAGGRVLAEGTTAELTGAETAVAVRTTSAGRLAKLAAAKRWDFERDGRDRLLIRGASAGQVGRAAAREGIVLTELSTKDSTKQLEQLFFELTGTKAAP